MAFQYDKPLVITHEFGSTNFAGSPAATSFKGPKGMRGRILDIGVAVTTAFNAVSTSAKFNVGTSADADAYASLDMGTAAATDVRNTQDDPDAIIEPDLPADTQIEVTYVAPTGGTPAGVGKPYIVVGWY